MKEQKGMENGLQTSQTHDARMSQTAALWIQIFVTKIIREFNFFFSAFPYTLASSSSSAN